VDDRWFVDETYVKVGGNWRYVYRAVDQFGQIVDVYVAARRDVHRSAQVLPACACRDQGAADRGGHRPGRGLPGVLDELLPAAWHRDERYANDKVEADHGRLKHRLRPMRGLRNDRTARVVITGPAFVQNVRRGHYELGVEVPATLRLAASFTELAAAI
jgi:transposase-like protein